MPDTETKTTKASSKGDARDLARTKRADLIVEAQLAEEAQMHATIDAVEAKIDSLDNSLQGVTVKGNQGRP